MVVNKMSELLNKQLKLYSIIKKAFTKLSLIIYYGCILETLEHVYEPNVTLKEAHRLLRDNGRIIVSVPLPEHDIHKSYHWPEFISLHVQSFNFESIKKILIDTGFSKIIDVSTDRHLVVMATKKIE